MSKLNKCSRCSKYVSSITTLIKIKEKWFCIQCIISNKDIFNLLKRNGIIYNNLKRFIKFKNDKI